MPESAVVIARAIKGLMAERGITQQRVAEEIGRVQGYVSERCSGLDAWNTAELEQISRLLGFADAFALMDEIQKRR